MSRVDKTKPHDLFIKFIVCTVTADILWKIPSTGVWDFIFSVKRAPTYVSPNGCGCTRDSPS